jgi:hypothetical protein
VAHESGKAVKTYAPATLILPVDISATHICQRLSLSQGHGDAGRIKPTKNPADPITNQTHDLTAFSTVPQPTVLPQAPLLEVHN